MMHFLIEAIMAALLTSTMTAAAQDSAAGSVPVTLSAGGGLESGQIVEGKYRGSSLGERVWLGRSVVNLGAHARRGRLTAAFKLQGELWFNTYTYEFNKDRNITPFRPYTKINLLDAYATISPFGEDRPVLRITSGVFEYRYDPYARNLGEYLFRSGAYPPYLITEFDYTQTVLTGIKVSSLLAGMLTQDLIFSTERKTMPYHDFSLSYLAGLKPLPVVDIGAGISFCRLFPVNDRYTTPEFNENRYLIAPGDTGYYSFSGIKLMARLALDPKPLFGSPRIFGTSDMRLYAEGAVLGLKSLANTDTTAIPVPSYYDDLSKRMPVMMGFNIPAFKILDVLAVEIEYFGWNYPNTFYRRQGQNYEMPIPAPFPGATTMHDYESDNWKWSVYAKKTMLKNFSITGQIARDHLRHRIFIELYNDEEELLGRGGDWYWMVKLEANI